MAITILDELDLTGPVPNFQRDIVNTIAEFSSSTMLLKYPDLFEVNCKEDGCRYRLNKKNTVDPVLGKWRKVERIEMALANSDGPLGEEVAVERNIGYIEAGETLHADVLWQEVVRMITIPYVAPTIDISVITGGISLNPETNIIWVPANISNSPISSIELRYDITSGSEDIRAFEITAEDGTSSKDITPEIEVSNNISENLLIDFSEYDSNAEEISITTVVSDKRKDTSKEIIIDKTGAPVFFGVDGRMQSDWPEEWNDNPKLFLDWHPIDTYYTEETLNGLQQLNKYTNLTADTLPGTTFHIATNSPLSGGPEENYFGGTVVFAFPKAFGEIKNFVFNNFTYTDLQTAEITVRGIPYWVSRVNTCVFSYTGDGNINLK